ncbi:S9 family peptidase [Phytohabitans kaempferiae]|uniref:Prolyl oligopeptidase family serine peptidase n=1 Tax=Phytohabitans kaempferiae TaxID=1620943 RepID=A0ABV6MHQ0_9ACTN
MEATAGAMLDAYRRAEVLGSRWDTLIDNARVVPIWDMQSSDLWYRSETPEGWAYMSVCPALGTRRPAFDHERLANRLMEASGSILEPNRLPLRELRVDGGVATFDSVGYAWSYDAHNDVLANLGGPRATLFGQRVSPDGSKRAARNGHDVVVTTAHGELVRLTNDGESLRSYGAYADAFVPFQALQLSKSKLDPLFASWSPDSRVLLTYICDQSRMSDLWLLETSPLDGSRPKLHAYKYGFPGEEMPLGTWVAFDTIDGRRIEFSDPEFLLREHPELLLEELRWSADSRYVFYVHHDRDPRVQRLKRMDVATGSVVTLVVERGERAVQRRLFGAHPYHVLDNGAAALWWSERDGRGHLYRYDADTSINPRQVSSGEFSVRSVEHVDDASRTAIVTIAGMCVTDPYFRVPARLSIDTGELVILGDVNIDHVVSVSPDGRWLVDTTSTFTDPPRTVVLDATGAVVAELETADPARLVRLGWTGPERVRTKGADGETDIYSLVYKPHGFSADATYPVVEHIYPGPQLTRASPFTSSDTAFGARAVFGTTAESLAALGFVVVLIDGRGTPGRDRSFHDYAYGHLDDASCLADHVAALEELAKDRPWMDMSRVGICGASGGGFMTVRAMMRYPDFYRVGVSAAGNHDMYRQNAAWPEVFDGIPDSSAQWSASQQRLANASLADHLDGKLLLIHGAMDENVPLHQTLGLVQVLVDADKDFDLLILPRGDHAFHGCEAYVTRRTWDYLVRHLHGVEPPRYRLARDGEVPLTSVFAAGEGPSEPSNGD